MRFDYQNLELQEALAGASGPQEIEAVLQRIIQYVPALMAPDIRGRKLFWPALDALVADLPRRLNLPDVALAKGQGDVVVLATRFYPTGGHSRVAADIARLTGAAKVTLVFTDIYRQLRQANMVQTAAGDQTFLRRAGLLLTAPTLVEKIIELHMILAAIRPGRIFLLNNHMDPVAVAGAWSFRQVVDYVHHADFMPALGSSLDFATHADLTYTCHLACREAGLDPIYAGMTTPPPTALRPTPAPGHGRLRIATCGGLHKYRQAGRYGWADYVVAALSAADAEMIHIGPVDEAFTTAMAQALTAAGIDPGRYRCVGPTDDLQAELVRRGADLYLSSYPESGGRAGLEAMVAGLPVITPVEPDLGPLLEDRWPFAVAVNVTSPAELALALRDSTGLVEAARRPEAVAALRGQLSRFEDYVAGRALAPIRPDDRL